ncbi:MAG: NAD-dependent epimerase/dehydratase family protein [Rhodospirillales bacterium]|nr:NAD-dependent epimerase/dehydratase family protein [Rhodospirillales bacterium]
MARYLITGGAGFIGSHLVEALRAAGAAVRVLDDLSTGRVENLPAGVEFLRGDVADPATARRAMAGIDGCFHLAAIASVARAAEDWPGTHRVNQGGTVAVLDAARARRVPVVYASSAAIYGDCPNQPIREDAPARPLSAYGADKLGSELHAAVATGVFAVPTVGLRFFNVYGPRQDPASPYSGVISIFAARLRRGEPVELHGDGCQTRDFIHVGDVVAALRAAMARLPPGAPVFNVCTGIGTTIRDLAEALAALHGRRAAIRAAPARPGDIRGSVGDPAAARATLGLGAPVGLRAGLATVRDWLAGTA